MWRPPDHFLIFRCEDKRGRRSHQIPQARATKDRSDRNEEEPQATENDRTYSGAREKSPNSQPHTILANADQHDHKQQYRSESRTTGREQDRAADGQNASADKH